MRAIGPSMAPGVPNTLASPSLLLRDSKGNLIAANDNWQSTIVGGAITSNQVSLIESDKLAPTDPNESALVVTLAPGDYTAVVNGSSGVRNIALVEVYDLDSFGASQLLNISTRGLISTGYGVMIAGVIVGGTENETVVMRGLGPSLGLSDPLPDPTLSLVDAQGNIIAQNNNWKLSPNAAEISSEGLAPTNQFESALLENLAPGNYTVILADSNGRSGVGLVEVYNLTNRSRQRFLPPHKRAFSSQQRVFPV